MSDTMFRELTNAELELVAGGLDEGFETPPGLDDPALNPYPLADPSTYLSFTEFSLVPVNPWDLGINPLIPDSLENWFYGRTSDGSGGAWENHGEMWTYWDENGNHVATYEQTNQSDPEVERVFTFTSDGGGEISGTVMTIFLRPVQ